MAMLRDLGPFHSFTYAGTLSMHFSLLLLINLRIFLVMFDLNYYLLRLKRGLEQTQVVFDPLLNLENCNKIGLVIQKMCVKKQF